MPTCDKNWWRAHHYRLGNLVELIEGLDTRDRRRLYSFMRSADEHNVLTPHTFFPRFGFTVGDFAVGLVLNDRRSQY